jgi:hypothetical protein
LISLKADYLTTELLLSEERLLQLDRDYATEPWGTPTPLTNQMTIVADVTIMEQTLQLVIFLVPLLLKVCRKY